MKKKRERGRIVAGLLTLVVMLATPMTASAQVTHSAVQVKDINPGSGNSMPQRLTDVGGTLFFEANDGTHGTELWKSDGTEAGTVLVKDIRLGLATSSPGWLTDVGGTLFFRANDGTNGTELWKSDGSEAGTVMVKDISPFAGSGAGGGASSFPSGLTDVGGTLFFSASDGINGFELWKSDGSEAGTVMVKDIAPGAVSSIPGIFTDVGGTLFFSADDGTHGDELWKSDGTEAGTVLVKDINPGSATSSVGSFTDVGGTLFFSANDGINGFELWKSDGSEAGTVMVKDINPGAANSSPSWFADVGGTLFFRADDGTNGAELWKSDGTEAGTVMVKDIRPGADSSSLSDLTDVGGTLFFSAFDDINGFELWKSDGTEAGTVMVKDIAPGFTSSVPRGFTDVGGTVFFTAGDGTNGSQLWKSDGTEAGTVMVIDTNPGAATSSPSWFADVGGTLFFAADDDGTHGRELWKVIEVLDDPALDLDPPLVADILAAPNPAPVATLVMLTATIDDTATGGSNVSGGEYSLDGGSTWVPMAATDGAFDSPMEDVEATVGPFAEPAVLGMCVRGTDAAGNTSPPECIMVAVYDPSAGFVTGGGWINSPAGAYVPDLTASGRANFGFVSRYKKGATTPSGQTEFQFRTVGLSFHSTEYDWLVISGATARYKGSGRINGAGNYAFMLWATDGSLPGGGGSDKFRLQVWDKTTGDTIYDNGSQQNIDGGSIKIHSK